MCDYCNYDKHTIYTNNLQICKECKQKNVLITQSKGMKKYALSKTDIVNIRHIQYKGSYLTYLFLKKDLHRISKKKYGSTEARKIVVNKRKNRREERENKCSENRKYRYDKLNNYLKQIGLPGIRSDSTICERYIELGEKSGFTVEQIGDIMSEMKFFYEKTNYSDILYRLRGEEMREMREYKGYYRWTDDDEEMIRKEAKHDALEKYVKSNYDNVHQLILDIPLSLQQEAQKIYQQIKVKSYKQPKQPKQVFDEKDQIIKKLEMTVAQSKKNTIAVSYELKKLNI